MKSKLLMRKLKMSVIMVMHLEISVMKMKMSMMKTKMSMMKLITMIHMKLKSMQSVMHLTVMTLMKNVMTFKMNYSIWK